MAEENWHQARLIPTSGISGADEQERRATSALLAVMVAVKEFGRTITTRVGAPRGRIETFIEVPFQLGEKRLFPDGLIRVSRGATCWTALVEVKTVDNALGVEQLESYLDVAREQGFDAVLSISNEIPPMPGMHPTQVDKRKLRKVALHHLAWSQIVAEAVMQKEHRGVADPDQAWILGELIRYLEHPRSGAMEFSDMGPSWVTVRESIAAGTLRANDKGLRDVVARWDALIRVTALQLGRKLGEEVSQVLTRKELAEPTTRSDALVNQVVATGTLSGGIRIPNSIGPIEVTADLRANRITCQVAIDAPESGRATTRVKWLLRQLTDAPEILRIEAYVRHARGSGTAELLKDVRANPELLVADPTKELRSFTVAMTTSMGLKRGTGKGSFIASVQDTVNVFYGQVVQNLKAWRAAPPVLRELPPESVDPSRLASTALSSQDGAEPDQGSDAQAFAPAKFMTIDGPLWPADRDDTRGSHNPGPANYEDPEPVSAKPTEHPPMDN